MGFRFLVEGNSLALCGGESLDRGDGTSLGGDDYLAAGDGGDSLARCKGGIVMW